MRKRGFLQGPEAGRELSPIVPELLSWYRRNKRSMRWRDEPFPYYVWVSEIMLQQTRIEAVKQYFDRFIHALPNITALADVEEDRLMKLWEGLGYYNRVRNMHKTANILVKQYGGALPSDYKELMNLPGIGSYTAGAIASISYGVKAPAVDGNVLRVVMRILGCGEDVNKASTKKSLETILMSVIPEEAPGDFNQGIMELGETICIPNGKPLCEECPVNNNCKAFLDGEVDVLPVKTEKKHRKKTKKTILLLEYQGRYAIRKRMGKGLLQGLWEIPNIEGHLTISGVQKELPMVRKDMVHEMGEAKHVFSHVEWHMKGYLIRMNDFIKGEDGSILKDLVWVNAEEVKEDYALPTAFGHYRSFIT